MINPFYNSDWIERSTFYLLKEGTVNQYEATLRPMIVCLCGSTRFKEQYEEAVAKEGLKGKIVLSCAQFGHADNLILPEKTKKFLDVLHKRKIDLADEIFVIDPGNYIGESTADEIAYSEKGKKRIRYWSKEIRSSAVTESFMKMMEQGCIDCGVGVRARETWVHMKGVDYDVAFCDKCGRAEIKYEEYQAA